MHNDDAGVSSEQARSDGHKLISARSWSQELIFARNQLELKKFQLMPISGLLILKLLLLRRTFNTDF